jgi:hypothetical protein
VVRFGAPAVTLSSAAADHPFDGPGGSEERPVASRQETARGWRRLMTYDEVLADRIRTAVEAAAGPAGFREIKMFGGLCWTVNTHMAVGTGGDDLMVHVGKDGVAEALEHGARPATMGERTMGGVVLVAAADLPDAGSLGAWVGPAVERARARPPKPSKK